MAVRHHTSFVITQTFTIISLQLIQIKKRNVEPVPVIKGVSSERVGNTSFTLLLCFHFGVNVKTTPSVLSLFGTDLTLTVALSVK